MFNFFKKSTPETSKKEQKELTKNFNVGEFVFLDGEIVEISNKNEVFLIKKDGSTAGGTRVDEKRFMEENQNGSFSKKEAEKIQGLFNAISSNKQMLGIITYCINNLSFEKRDELKPGHLKAFLRTYKTENALRQDKKINELLNKVCVKSSGEKKRKEQNMKNPLTIYVKYFI